MLKRIGKAIIVPRNISHVEFNEAPDPDSKNRDSRTDNIFLVMNNGKRIFVGDSEDDFWPDIMEMLSKL